MRSQNFIQLEHDFGAHNYLPIPVVIEKGEGVWLWDVEGKRYLDMMSAYSAVSHGHRHPRIMKAIEEQMKKCCVVSRAYHTDQLGPFCKKLCDMSGFDKVLPMNTGAEAVETAIKGARKWGYDVKGIPDGQAEIIVAGQNFHGRTTTIVSFSSEKTYKHGFEPLTPGFKEIPFGNSDALEAAITPNTCAFLVEPIQGEAGIIVPPEGWLKKIRDICTKHNVLLIMDEVQSGLGRSGALFAFQHENIQPDGLILGKALGGGALPISAFLATNDVMQVFTPGTHGSTFGGNPLAVAAAMEALQVLLDEKLTEKSAELGTYLTQRLKELNSPLIKNVRGKGLWIGVEIDSTKARARKVCEKMAELGVLSKETHETVVRLAPPLTITKEELDHGIELFAQALKSLE